MRNTPDLEEMFGLKPKPTRADLVDEYILVNRILKELGDYRAELRGKLLEVLNKTKTKTTKGELGSVHLERRTRTCLSVSKAREVLPQKTLEKLLEEKSFDTVKISARS